MNCDICERPYHVSRLPFLCAVDARNCCYEGRVRNLQMLMENERLQKQIDDVVSQKPQASGSKKVTREVLLSERRALEDRTSQILARSEKLRGDIAAAREEIRTRKDAVARRRSDLTSASNGIASRRAKLLEDTERSVTSLRHEWARVADSTAGTRAFLCMEAAKLYGLRRVKKGSSRYEYKLGGIDVVDLASMNALAPEVISTSLAHIAHMLVLASHYLSIRLPAEITTPRRDYPRPTIFNLSSSYQHGESRLAAGMVATIPDTGDARYRDSSSTSRPRPLFIEKTLPVLAKDDPSAHSFFLEGVTLLAYDVAWLCLSQNVPIGDRMSFDDVCNMGRNLYNLLIGTQLHSNQVAVAFPALSSSPRAASGGGDVEETKPASLMGRFSHGTAHSFLGSAAGTEFVRSFKLPSPMKLVDKLKKKLGSELAIPEWEVVENGDWEDVV